jgi:peptidoglycan-N-acetylglucosamine deacetylase
MTIHTLKNSSIHLTIDVEDWFQVENFKQYIPFSSWASRELRVEKNVHHLLDLFDSVKVGCGSPFTVHGLQFAACKVGHNQPSASSCQQNYSSKAINPIDSINPSNPKATFFVLGWLAERLPNLVREIHSHGHEVASHGYNHNLCYECGNNELQEDISKSKKLLEDTIGSQVFGYRAPSFSINNDVLKIIEDCGYLYDSSYNSFGMHSRYGRLDVSNFQKDGIALRVSDSFYELPISNLNIKNPIRDKLSAINNKQNNALNSSNPINPSKPASFILPWGGGGYFRIIPFYIFKKGIKSILKRDNAYLFYMHPWEIDLEQPRVIEAPASFKLRHYINLKTCESKLSRLINTFQDSRFLTCHQYIA